LTKRMHTAYTEQVTTPDAALIVNTQTSFLI
jgi:hypothetical protein